MSLMALVTGTLIKPPTIRTAKTGQPFTVSLMRCASDDGNVLVSLIAFGQAGRDLAALAAGDSLSATGGFKLSEWEKDGEQRHGLAMTVDSVLTLHQVNLRRRQARDA
jgi:hypothetical protein